MTDTTPINIKVTNMNLLYSIQTTFKYSDDCMICTNCLNDDSIFAQEANTFSQASTGKCGHTFHSDCINKWLKSNYNQCPSCRQQFK